MSDINPTEVYRKYESKELDRVTAVGYLKSIIERSSDEELRVQSVEFLGEMSLEEGELFEFFEHLVTSDESNHVRLESLKIILRDFHEIGIEAIHHVIKHEKSVDNLLFLYRYLENINSPESNRILNEMEIILGGEYSKKFKIIPKEAMALQLISLLTGLEAIHSHYWRDASCVAILPKKGKIISLVIHDVKYSGIKIMDFFSSLEVLTISSTDLTEIKNLESLINLKFLDLNYNKITRIKGLSKLVNLEELDLSYNPITKIEGLENLKKLKSVNFEECELNYSEIEQYFQKLNRKNVIIY